MFPNNIRDKLDQNQRPILGASLQIDSPFLVEMLAHAGFDYVMLDGEHGAATYNLPALIMAAQGANITPIVRVPNHDRGFILPALELGAGGVQVPMVETPEQAMNLVSEVKYAPLGNRGFSTATRSARYGIVSREEYADHANRNTMLFLTIETQLGRQNASAIARVPGVDLIFIGRDDLSESIGELGNRDAKAVHQAMRNIIQDIKGRVPIGSTAFRQRDVETWLSEGIDLFLTATTRPIQETFQRIVKDLSHADYHDLA